MVTNCWRLDGGTLLLLADASTARDVDHAAGVLGILAVIPGSLPCCPFLALGGGRYGGAGLTGGKVEKRRDLK